MSALKHARHEFNRDVRDRVAKRAGYICSFPECNKLTVGPSDTRVSGVSLVGVAAHICAAAPGGPRYEPSQSEADRRAESNAIWLCGFHNTVIDSDAKNYPASLLHRWKAEHERFVRARLEGTKSWFSHGVTRIKLKGFGIFQDSVEVQLHRHNIFLGNHRAGKTTICQAIAALSGARAFQQFVQRFKIFSPDSSNAFIEAHSSAHGGTTVRLTTKTVVSKKTRKPRYKTVHVEANGGVVPCWPKGSFNVVHLDDQFVRNSSDRKSGFPLALKYLADVFDVDEEIVWSSLREELFTASLLGYEFKRRKSRDVEVQVPHSGGFFLPYAGISGSEETLAILDVAHKFIQAQGNPIPWTLVVDTGFYGRLDQDNKKKLFRKLVNAQNDNLQTIVCVTFEKDADLLRDEMIARWVFAQKAGELVVHNFR